jgi:hypothetical protein
MSRLIKKNGKWVEDKDVSALPTGEREESFGTEQESLSGPREIPLVCKDGIPLYSNLDLIIASSSGPIMAGEVINEEDPGAMGMVDAIADMQLREQALKGTKASPTNGTFPTLEAINEEAFSAPPSKDWISEKMNDFEKQIKNENKIIEEMIHGKNKKEQLTMNGIYPSLKPKREVLTQRNVDRTLWMKKTGKTAEQYDLEHPRDPDKRFDGEVKKHVLLSAPGVYVIICEVTKKAFVDSTQNLYISMKARRSNIRRGILTSDINPAILDDKNKYILTDAIVKQYATKEDADENMEADKIQAFIDLLTSGYSLYNMYVPTKCLTVK